MDNDPSRAYYRIQHSNGTRFAKKYPTLESFLHGDKQIAMNDKFTEQEKIDYYNEMKKLAEPSIISMRWIYLMIMAATIWIGMLL